MYMIAQKQSKGETGDRCLKSGRKLVPESEEEARGRKYTHPHPRPVRSHPSSPNGTRITLFRSAPRVPEFVGGLYRCLRDQLISEAERSTEQFPAMGVAVFREFRGRHDPISFSQY
jgi:hypothetical protein